MIAIRRALRALSNQRGTTLAEVVISGLLTTLVVGSLSVLVGAATRSKMIVAVRSADTESARQTLEWMSERLRNAGLNVRPSLQPEGRCQDMVVAQDPALRPQTNSVYVSGEVVNTDTTAGNEVITIGYRLQSGIVVEDRGACAGAWAPTSSQVSNPRVTVTGLAFRYFTRTGAEITVPTTDPEAIRSIRSILITLTVQGEEGTSGTQAQTFTRAVMLRNPRPDTNDWLSPTETNP
jgi:type II secretory pathway component PulJ